jgi:GntP family gluconate:H+ symporter
MLVASSGCEDRRLHMIESPLVVLVLGMAFVVVTIVVLRVHAFLALIFAAILVGILSPAPLAPGSAIAQPILALQTTAQEFGRVAGNIGIIIVLASIIGKCLMDSGAAEAITRRFLRLLGQERASLALLGSGFVLSIPVFFDTVFYLLVPLAKALRFRTGGHYALYVMAICVGAGLTHSLVAPTPGPLIMADNLHLDLGTTIAAGIAFSLIPGIVAGWFFARWQSRRLDIPLRESADFSASEIQELVERGDSELPGFWISILPIALPVLLIAGATISDTVNRSSIQAGGTGLDSSLLAMLGFLGDRNAALIVSMIVAVWLLLRHKGLSLRQLRTVLEPSIASAGIIILITSAGGAFGAMIRLSGIGDTVGDHVTEGASGMLLILLAFGVSSVMKIAQGSTTVAVITASAIVYGIIEGLSLPYHPVYLFLAIGFGGMVFSWMNDSGFWIVSRMSGFTERETFFTWTLAFALTGLVGLAEVLILSQFLTLKFLP